MNLLMFLKAVAHSLDRESGLTIASGIVGAREKELEIVVEDRFLGKAVAATIRRMVPLFTGDVSEPTPTGSVPVVVRDLLEVVRLRSELDVADKRLWANSSMLQELLSRTVNIFLDELTGVAREIDRKEDRLEATRTAILNTLQGTMNVHLNEVILRWGSVMLEPQNLFGLAAELRPLGNDERIRILSDIVARVTDLDHPPSPDEFIGIVRLIKKTPVGKA